VWAKGEGRGDGPGGWRCARGVGCVGLEGNRRKKKGGGKEGGKKKKKKRKKGKEKR
jgi:hypothetical protein